MAKQKFTNNATALITSNITTSSASFTIESAFADRFPVLLADEFFIGTLQNAAGDIEIVKVTKRDVGSNAMQMVERAQEGTTALPFSAGEAVFAVRATAGHHQAVAGHIEAEQEAHMAAAIAFEPVTDKLDSTTSQAATLEVYDKLMAALAAMGLAKLSITDLIGQTFSRLTTAGTAPAFTITPTPALAAYAEGQRYLLKTHGASGAGASTLNVSGLGAKGLKVYSPWGSKLDPTFYVDQLLDVIYDGTHFVILNMTGVSEPVGDYRWSATPTQAPGTRRILIQGQAVSLVSYPTLEVLWCGATLNNHADEKVRADFYYRCVDPANPNTTRSALGEYLVLPLPEHFLRPLKVGSGTNLLNPYKIQGDAIRNIKGATAEGVGRGLVTEQGTQNEEGTGAIRVKSSGARASINSTGSMHTRWAVYDFDASREVPTGDENRPKGFGGYLWLCY